MKRRSLLLILPLLIIIGIAIFAMQAHTVSSQRPTGVEPEVVTVTSFRKGNPYIKFIGIGAITVRNQTGDRIIIARSDGNNLGEAFCLDKTQTTTISGSNQLTKLIVLSAPDATVCDIASNLEVIIIPLDSRGGEIQLPTDDGIFVINQADECITLRRSSMGHHSEAVLRLNHQHESNNSGILLPFRYGEAATLTVSPDLCPR